MQGLRGTHLAHDFLGQGLPLYSQAEARAAPLESKERRIKGHAANGGEAGPQCPAQTAL